VKVPVSISSPTSSTSRSSPLKQCQQKHSSSGSSRSKLESSRGLVDLFLLEADKRYNKEVNIYKQEAEEQKKTLEKLKADGADEWTLKNGVSNLRGMEKADGKVKVIEESEKMVPRTEANLAKAVEELEDLVVSDFNDIAKKLIIRMLELLKSR
jgi:hypothetical protein